MDERTLQDACMHQLSPQNEAAALAYLLAKLPRPSQLRDEVVEHAQGIGEEGPVGLREVCTHATELAQWLERQGGHSMVAPADFGGERGLAAAEAVDAGKHNLCCTTCACSEVHWLSQSQLADPCATAAVTPLRWTAHVHPLITCICHLHSKQ